MLKSDLNKAVQIMCYTNNHTNFFFIVQCIQMPFVQDTITYIIFFSRFISLLQDYNPRFYYNVRLFKTQDSLTH